MPRRNFGDGALRLIAATTATGVSDVASINTASALTVHVVGPSSDVTGTLIAEVGLDGTHFYTAIAATTFNTSTSGSVAPMLSTSTALFTQVRLNLTVTGTTKDVTVYVAGK